MKNQTILCTLLLLFSLLVSACANTAQAAPAAVSDPASDVSSETVIAEGQLVPGKHIGLSFVNGGRVAEVTVSEGQHVRQGQALARLEGSAALLAQQAAAQLEIIETRQAMQNLDENALLALALASAELEAAQKAYDDAERGWNGKTAANPSAFDTALGDYLAAEAAVRQAQKQADEEADQPADAPTRLQAGKDLQREQTRRANAYQALRNDYENPQEGSQTEKRTVLLAAITRLETARLELDKLAGGPDPDLSELLDARLKAAQATLSATEEGLRALEIIAPWDGILLAWDLEVGEIAAPGQWVGALADTSAWYVETTDLTENGVVDIQAGATAKISVDALSGENFSGKVESIRGYGEKYQGDMTYTVRIRLDQNDPRWYWNMNVLVTVIVTR
ncbi:MAG: HlyD family secretion protein [Chloroflexota bacterium]